VREMDVERDADVKKKGERDGCRERCRCEER
jgi:hypothetical protein